jgi:hypothetical protein
MCLKPQLPQPIPEMTVALALPLFSEGSVYQFIGDALFEQFRDEDFADLYPTTASPVSRLPCSRL